MENESSEIVCYIKYLFDNYQLPSYICEKPCSSNSIPSDRHKNIITEDSIDKKIAHSFKMFLQNEEFKIREKHCDNCDNNMISDRVSAIFSQMMDAIMHLQNETRQMQEEFRHVQQHWEKRQQDDRASLRSAHDKLDRIITWIESQSTETSQLSDKSDCGKSIPSMPIVDVPNQVDRNGEKVTPGDVGPLAGRGELVWPIDNFRTRRHQLTSGATRCLDSPEFASEPTGYRVQLRLWMSETGVEVGVRMLEARERVNGVPLWPVTFQVTVGVVDATRRDQFLFQEKRVIEYKNPAFSSSSVVRFPSAQVTRVAARSDLVVMRCLAADSHCSPRAPWLP